MPEPRPRDLSGEMDRHRAAGGRIGPRPGAHHHHPPGRRRSPARRLQGDRPGSGRLGHQFLQRAGGLGAAAARRVGRPRHVRRRSVEHRRRGTDRVRSGADHVGAPASAGREPLPRAHHHRGHARRHGGGRAVGRPGRGPQDLRRGERDLRGPGPQLRGRRADPLADLRPLEAPGHRLDERHRALPRQAGPADDRRAAPEPLVAGPGDPGGHRGVCPAGKDVFRAQAEGDRGRQSGGVPARGAHVAIRDARVPGMRRARRARRERCR